jgi:hypothetical protein
MKKLIVIMDRGIVQGIFFEGEPSDIQVEVWDHDIEGLEEDKITAIAGAEVYIQEEEVYPITKLFAYNTLKEKGEIK